MYQAVPPISATVLCLRDLAPGCLAQALAPYGLQVVTVADTESIPGSYWGEAEAGLIGNQLLVRQDTPIHSALHEACHYLCLDETRRLGLHTDAGGDYDEENGVCYLQILLADFVPPMHRARMWADMDAWGYTFRLGSAQRWFEQDAEDARAWLLAAGLIDATGQPSWRLRQK